MGLRDLSVRWVTIEVPLEVVHLLTRIGHDLTVCVQRPLLHQLWS